MKKNEFAVNPHFDAVKTSERISKFILDFLISANAGEESPVIVPISGGKDSAIAAYQLVKTIGANRVVGLLLPNGTQKDMHDSFKVCDNLEIKRYAVNIGDVVSMCFNELSEGDVPITEELNINIPPRVRMTAAYAVAEVLGGYVVNTCNLSEDYIGYSTKYGDGAGDFSLFGSITCSEMFQLGLYLGVPASILSKPPSDGLCGKTDEESFGFSYAVLDEYIRTGYCKDSAIKEKIDSMHSRNRHKVKFMPVFDSKKTAEEDSLAKKLCEIPKIYESLNPFSKKIYKATIRKFLVEELMKFYDIEEALARSFVNQVFSNNIPTPAFGDEWKLGGLVRKMEVIVNETL